MLLIIFEYIDNIEMIRLKCGQILENVEGEETFGPHYATKNVNYLLVMALCPSNCYASSATVQGMGIHPSASPICESAIIDKAMPPYGGVIAINIFQGLKSYPLSNKGRKK